MSAIDQFAHGHLYGDYSGVNFYGPPKDGCWPDRLAISNCYIGPLFRGILNQAWGESGGETVPRLASDWNSMEGWTTANGPVPVPIADATQFAEALAQLGPADVADQCTGCTVDECLRCAGVIREFIGNRLASGIFIEDD